MSNHHTPLQHLRGLADQTDASRVCDGNRIELRRFNLYRVNLLNYMRNKKYRVKMGTML